LSISVGPAGQGNSPSLNNNEDIEAPLIPAGRLLPFLVVTVLFFLWAIPNNLNDILIRQFMKSFNINRSSAAGIQIWFYLGYFLLAIPAGQLMRRFGYKMGYAFWAAGASCFIQRRRRDFIGSFSWRNLLSPVDCRFLRRDRIRSLRNWGRRGRASGG
jgi:hypothetical protein